MERKYDFDTPADRRGAYSLKWDVKDHELPMWVADMDFQTAPEILEAVKERASQGCFGYTVVPEEWYQSIVKWWGNHHYFVIEKEWLMFCTGVVAAISSVIRRLTAVGENVVILTPVYNIFVNSVVNNGRHLVESPLLYENGNYEIDYMDLKQKLSHPETTMLILCNPHNPVGKIWDKEILIKIGNLCDKYHVAVISDEIHCDLTVPGARYTPFASASDVCRRISVTCIAPTKAFNLAGLQTAAMIVPDEALRQKVNRGINNDEVAEPGAFAITAAIAAYEKGSSWLDALNLYLHDSRAYVQQFIEKELPMLKLVQSEATYLLWIDCSRITQFYIRLAEFLRKDTGLYITDGKVYGGNGACFLRINIACPFSYVKKGMERLREGILHYEAKYLQLCES